MVGGQVGAGAPPGAGRPWIGEDDGRRALLVDGVVQSIAVEPGDAVDGYWAALLPRTRPRQALVLGLGGGTIVHLLRQRFGTVAVVAVEIDPEVLALARAELGLDLAGLEVVRGDAFAFVQHCRMRFDYVCVDLYRGGQLDRRVLGRPFLRSLKALAMPGAEIAFNLVRDRRLANAVQRIDRILPVRSTQTVGRNVIVWAGPRPVGRSG